VVTELLRRVVPAPLQRVVRKVVALLRLSPQPRKQRIWRRRNRPKRVWLRMWRKRRWLKRRIWHMRRWLEQRMWLRIWHLRRGERPAETSDQIHIISPSGKISGGGPIIALSLFDELKNLGEISLWTEYKVHPEIAEKYLMKQILPERFEFPRSGTLVLVGTYIHFGPWIRYANPRRVIWLHMNNMPPTEFRRKLRKLSAMSGREVEMVYLSEFIKRSADYPGLVERSRIDTVRFVPSVSKPSDSASANFTVGRLSRADPEKHHPDDPALYRRLVDHGCRVRIMGASASVEAELSGLESVALLPAFAQEPHQFLQGLDCFFYRTSKEWPEPWGRVVPEAMGCGLPVVCHNRGGYVEIIDHGRNGFLFDTQEEALEILLRLKEDRALRESIGKAARETVEELFSPARRSEILEFYLR
jgi:glycosyltransferase involved in cell wall biosynthesis